MVFRHPKTTTVWMVQKQKNPVRNHSKFQQIPTSTISDPSTVPIHSRHRATCRPTSPPLTRWVPRNGTFPTICRMSERSSASKSPTLRTLVGWLVGWCFGTTKRYKKLKTRPETNRSPKKGKAWGSPAPWNSGGMLVWWRVNEGNIISL